MIDKIRQAKPEQIFLIIGLIWGVAFLVITPPFQVPDEPEHYFKALSLSDGQILPEEQGGRAGIYIPENALLLYGEFEYAFHTENKVNISHTQSLISSTYPHNDPIIFKGMSEIAIVTYSPVPYLVAALFMFIGKLFNLSLLTLLYMGRFSNLLLYIVLVFMAIKIIPVQKWVFLLLALMPMTLFLAASLSADSFTIAISFLTIAIFFKLALDKEKKKINRKDIYILLILGTLLALSKPVYLLLLSLFIMIPAYKFETSKKMVLAFISIFGSSILIYVLWNFLVSGFYRPQLGISIKNQSLFILSNPLTFTQTLLNIDLLYFKKYLLGFVGFFGWEYAPLPDLLVYLYIIVLILVAVFDKKEIKIDLKQKIVYLTTFFVMFVSIFAAEYITWNSVGSTSIKGIQGRYFIPIAPLFFFLFYNRKIKVNQKGLNWTIPLFILIVLSISLYVIIKRFYIP